MPKRSKGRYSGCGSGGIRMKNWRNGYRPKGRCPTVDPDARLMHSNGDARKLDVCYNVQTVVDDKYHLIVDFDIADRSDDHGNLHPMMEKAKEALEVQRITCLADTGYYDGQDIAACEEQGVTCLVAKGRPGGPKKTEAFSRERFIFRERDCSICPQGNRLGNPGLLSTLIA